MAIGGIDVGQELLNVPMGKMIHEMALAIADAQWQLDKSSMTVAELMSGQRLLRDLDSGKLLDEKGQVTGTPTVLDSRVYFGYTFRQNDKNEMVREPLKVSMMELGFTPTFYQFIDTLIEVKISITITGTSETSNSSSQGSQDASSSWSNYYNRQNGWWWFSQYASSGAASRSSVNTSQVNAAYSNKYSYSVDGSSLLRTKLVPVPPPAVLEDRIRDVMVMERAYVAYQLQVDAINRSGKTDAEKDKDRLAAADAFKAATSA